MRARLRQLKYGCLFVLCAFAIGCMWIAGILMLTSPVWVPVTVVLLVAKMLGWPS